MKKYKVIKQYVDKMFNKEMKVNEEIEVTKERAKELIDKKLIVEITKK